MAQRSSKSSNLRTKVVALLVSLAALWAFAAWVTLQQGVNLLGVQALNNNVYQPSAPLLLALQTERRLSMAYLSTGSQSDREALDAEREKAEAAESSFRKSSRSWTAQTAGSSLLKQRIDLTLKQLDDLRDTRGTIDARSVDRSAAAATFTDIVDSIFRVYDALGSLDDKTIAAQAAALIQLNRAWELISQEDALVTGVITAGRTTPAEYAQFVQLVGAQRFFSAQTATQLESGDRTRYDQMVAGQPFTELRNAEDSMIASGRTSSRPPLRAMQWRATVDPALAALSAVVNDGGDALVRRSTPIAVWVILRLVLAAGLGLCAVVASVIVSVTTARALVAQLERLREAARRLANEQLPGVVDRLGRGEQVNVALEAPPLEFGTDEIGQVGQAFNAVQETAIRTAVEQAELRRSVRDIFLSLARRTQALVHRQLSLLDTMERRENDAEDLEELFRIDHLATRMRRNAENLIVLSGSSPGRAWRRNVPMIDVVRGAVAEVEDYERVTVLPLGEATLAGRAVGDVIHLLAELIENALSFSPPHTGVEVKGQAVANGFVVEIEDRGLGMTEEELAAANEQITRHEEFSLANAARLGLYVVSRLAERQGIKVRLKESPYGGTTAVVLIPRQLVADAPEDDMSGTEAGRPAAGPVPTGATEEFAGLGTRPGPRHRSVAVADGPAQPPTAIRSPLTAPPARPAPTPEPYVPQQRTEPYQAPGGEWGPPGAAGGPGSIGGAAATDRAGSAGGQGPLGDSGPIAGQSPFGGSAPLAGQGPIAGPNVLGAGPASGGLAGGGPASGGPAGGPFTGSAPVGGVPAGGTPLRGVPVAGSPPPPETQPPIEGGQTPSGLPFRVRQANLAKPLREGRPAPETPAGQPARAPEEIRSLMSSYQSGTRRGRTDAARLLNETPDPQSPPPHGADGPPPGK